MKRKTSKDVNEIAKGIVATSTEGAVTERSEGHTPTPWGNDYGILISPSKVQIATVTQIADAEFIVRAVNEYEQHKEDIDDPSIALDRERMKVDALLEAAKAYLQSNNKERDEYALIKAIREAQGTERSGVTITQAEEPSREGGAQQGGK